MTFSVLIVGGITRLTHSGLSMVEWQPLVGTIPPLNETQWMERFDQYRQFPEYQQLRQGMTLQQFKVIFFWEYLHRLLARLIGLAFIVPFIAFWRSGSLSAPIVRRVLAILALGLTQGAMGWLMVRSGLVDRPSVSHYRLAAHLTIAFAIFGFCVWVTRELALGRRQVAVTIHTRRVMVRGLAIVGGLIAAQVVWGAFVAGLKAGLIFGTFPLMAGHLLPPRLLGTDWVLIDLVQDVAAVQWMHRAIGTLLLLAVYGVFVLVRRAEPDTASRRLSLVLVILIASQYALGVATLLQAVPPGLAVVHQATALAIVGVWVGWTHHVRNLAVLSAAGPAVPYRPESQADWSRRTRQRSQSACISIASDA